MKKSILTVLVAFALFPASCRPKVEPEDPEILPPAPEFFTATFEKLTGELPQGSTYAPPQWTAGAFIEVFPQNDPGNSKVFMVAEKSAGKEEGVFEDPHFHNYDRPCYALYPSGFNAEVSGTGLRLELPRNQEYISGGPHYGANPMLAYNSGDGELVFRHLCSVLALTIESRVPIDEVCLTSKKDEPLWGVAEVEFSPDGEMAARIVENGSERRNSLVVKLREDAVQGDGNENFTITGNATVSEGFIDGGGTYRHTVYFVVPSGSLQEGCYITVNGTGGGYMQLKCDPFEQGRGAITQAGFHQYGDETVVEARQDVLNKAFYKDIFMDSGVSVTSNTSMPVVDHLGIELEYFRADGNTDVTRAKQGEIYVGTADDLNGRILYPDGEPRYRMVYVNGGSSATHGFSLESEGRDRYRQFVARGGSYLGSCAGAYFATQGYALDKQSTPNYLGIWPSHCNRLATLNIYVGHSVPQDSPLLRYCNFGGDFQIDSVRHHNGPCFIDWQSVPGTEVLTRFDHPDSVKMHGHPAIIAYKPDIWQGRIIPCGSHPEQIPTGENLDLMAAMVRYCFDGLGIAKVKGVLKNGDLRRMEATTADNDPAYTRIGDLQCHHFIFSLPETARNVKVRLETSTTFRLDLMLAKDTFAFKEDANYLKEGDDKVKELTFSRLDAGVWYVGVQCMSTVTVTDEHGTYGTKYGNTAVLNGVPYTISVTWEY